MKFIYDGIVNDENTVVDKHAAAGQKLSLRRSLTLIFLSTSRT